MAACVSSATDSTGSYGAGIVACIVAGARESLGAALLLSGKAVDAERVFREDLVRNPRNARSLLGLHESLIKQGKPTDAAWVKRAFDEAWKDADTTVTLEGL